jgi:hypothetical protein
MSATIRTHFEFGRVRLSSGRLGKRTTLLSTHKYCPVDRCEQCGRYGSITWVKKWFQRPYASFDKRMKDTPDYGPDPVLCMSCMNRFRPHWRAQALVLENIRLINRIKREASRVRT